MVSAELAVALPAVILVLLMSLGALMVGIDQVRCTDAARVGSRAAARGDTDAVVRENALRTAPSGSTVSIGAADGLVRVTVNTPVRGPFSWVAGTGTLHSTGVAQQEAATP